jgi:hypothetical protein
MLYTSNSSCKNLDADSGFWTQDAEFCIIGLHRLDSTSAAGDGLVAKMCFLLRNATFTCPLSACLSVCQFEHISTQYPDWDITGRQPVHQFSDCPTRNKIGRFCKRSFMVHVFTFYVVHFLEQRDKLSISRRTIKNLLILTILGF